MCPYPPPSEPIPEEENEENEEKWKGMKGRERETKEMSVDLQEDHLPNPQPQPQPQSQQHSGDYSPTATTTTTTTKYHYDRSAIQYNPSTSFSHPFDVPPEQYTSHHIHQAVCHGLHAHYRFAPIRIHSEDCYSDGTRLVVPLPQLESQTTYGLRLSLPDMITDYLAGTPLATSSLENGKYLFVFTSLATSPRVFATMTSPATPWETPLDPLIEVKYSEGGFFPTNASMILQTAFGGDRVFIPIDHAGVEVEMKDIQVTVRFKLRMFAILKPATTYELILPVGIWKHAIKERPGTERFFFRTVDSMLLVLLLLFL